MHTEAESVLKVVAAVLVLTMINDTLSVPKMYTLET